MTGCGIAKILPEFYDKMNSNAIRYLPEPRPRDSSGSSASANYDGGGGVKEGEGEEDSAADAKTSKLMLQVNDLVVSINGISVLSRKYDIIMELLHHERFHHTDRIIVFRSIEKLWHSRRGSSSHHFTRRTMRNLRTGKRIATALNDDVVLTEDNSESLLRTWVDTPTQVSVAQNRKSRMMGGGVGGNAISTYSNNYKEEIDQFVPDSFTAPSTTKAARIFAPTHGDIKGNPWLSILWHECTIHKILLNAFLRLTMQIKKISYLR